MGEYFESFISYLGQNITAQLSDMTSNYIKDHKFPQNDMVFNFLMAAQQSSMLVSEILPIVSLLRASFDVRSPSDWVETEILSNDQLKALQLKFQEYKLDTDILSLNQTPINILDEYVVKQLPETINQANLKQILTQMIQTINILSQNQLKQTQQVKNSKTFEQQYQQVQKQIQLMQDNMELKIKENVHDKVNASIQDQVDSLIEKKLIKFVQEDVYNEVQQQIFTSMLPKLNEYVEQQIEKQKIAFTQYTQHMFDKYADAVELLACEVIKDSIQESQEGKIKLQSIKEKFQAIKQGIKEEQPTDTIQEQLNQIESKYQNVQSIEDTNIKQSEEQKELLMDGSYKNSGKSLNNQIGVSINNNSQINGQTKNISASQLKFSQLQPSNAYSIIKTFQQVDANELNYRINTIAQQTSRALEAINVTIKEMNRKIEESSRLRFSSLDTRQFQQLSEQIKDLDNRLQQFEAYQGE